MTDIKIPDGMEPQDDVTLKPYGKEFLAKHSEGQS